MKEAIAKYIAQATAAGFDVSDDVIFIAVDRGEFIQFVYYDDNEGQHGVARFYETDYAGCPEFEGTLAQCCFWVSNWEAGKTAETAKAVLDNDAKLLILSQRTSVDFGGR